MPCNDPSPRLYQAKSGSRLSVKVVSSAQNFVCHGLLVTKTAAGREEKPLRHDELLEGVERVVDTAQFTVIVEVNVVFRGDNHESAQVRGELNPPGKPSAPYCREVRGNKDSGTLSTSVGAMV